jgi:molybdopterin synthase sulfur carrier subunit
LRILLHGPLRQTIGREVEAVASAGTNVGELRRRLAADHPSAGATLARSRVYSGGCFRDDEHVLSGSEQIEILPPVSGG